MKPAEYRIGEQSRRLLEEIDKYLKSDLDGTEKNIYGTVLNGKKAVEAIAHSAPDPCSVLLSILDIDTAGKNALDRGDYKTLGDVKYAGLKKLRKLRYLGPKSLSQLMKEAGAYGIKIE